MPLKLKHRRSCRDGAAVVEIAITLPVLLFIAIATSDVCNSIFLKQSVAVMAFEGTRVAVTPGAVASDIEERVSQFAAIRNVNVESVEITPADFANQPTGTFIEVEVTGTSNLTTGVFTNSQSSVTVSMMKNY